MKLKRILLNILFISLISLSYSQSLEDILSSHYASKNQEALSQVTNMHLVSKVNRLGQSIQVEIWQERPHKMRMEVLVGGQKTIQVFNGEKGYVIAPQYGINEAQEITGEQLFQLSDQADIDGELFHWKEKGHQISLLGIEDFGDSKVFILKMITNTGQEKKFYLDGDSYLPIKMSGKYQEGGKLVEGESYYSDYRSTQDIMMPFSIENKMNGFKANSIIIQKIEFDISLDETIFNKPETSKPSLK